MEGALGLAHREHPTGKGFGRHQLLAKLIPELARFQILPFDELANRRFRSFPPSVRRIGQRDCMIAAQALERGYAIVTRNLADYSRIPGVQTANWAIPLS